MSETASHLTEKLSDTLEKVEDFKDRFRALVEEDQGGIVESLKEEIVMHPLGQRATVVDISWCWIKY